jgi:hypothetical protein
VRVRVPEVEAWIGARINRKTKRAAFSWLSNQKGADEFFECDAHSSAHPATRLTLAGWARYEELKRGRSGSRRAFMAMKFDEPSVQRAFQDCFKPAVKQVGFVLFDMREQQQAGLIDDLMRVAIRNSRFVIADLTHACRGSYWEGGFAEGLGRPVIYTCQNEAWEAEKTHFDTNHLTTVIWDENDLATAERKLVAIIRNTLPDEAKMDG